MDGVPLAQTSLQRVHVLPTASAVPVRKAIALQDEHFCWARAEHDAEGTPFAQTFEQAVQVEPTILNVPVGKAFALQDAQFC